MEQIQKSKAASSSCRGASAAALLFAFVVLTHGAAAAKPPKQIEDVYLTLEDALADVFPEAVTFEELRVNLTASEKTKIEKRTSRVLFRGDRNFSVYRAMHGDRSLAGYAMVTEEIGKYQPITFLVGVTEKAKVKDVAVMVYRETIGSEVRRSRFLSQFEGKSTQSAFRINRDVIHISGATLSSRAIARGIKKVIHTIDECVIGPRSRNSKEWRSIQVGKVARVANEKSARVPDSLPPDASVSPGAIKGTRYVMGTMLEIVSFGDKDAARRAHQAAFSEVARLERLLSTYRADSELSVVNRDAAKRPVKVSPATMVCVKAALDFARRTAGAFDPTLEKHGYRSVQIDPRTSTIRFRRAGLRLDLGGIGKGFALDHAARVLEKHGVSSSLLNFGGQVLALDAPPSHDAWVVPVRDPKNPQGHVGYFKVVQASISTSGAYERGQHIVDPRTGKPSVSALSTTVAAPSATVADALSTSLDVLGPSAAKRLTREFKRTATVSVLAGNRDLVTHESAGAPLFVRLPGSVVAR